MDIKEITDRSYAATVRRGLINDKTGLHDFFSKLYEEVNECENEVYNSDTMDYDDEFPEVFEIKKNDFSLELADIVLVCFAMAKHFDVDLFKAMEEKMLYNEKRQD